MAELTVSYAELTDQGDRSINEDFQRSIATQDGYVFILCDGLGGHGSGDEASQLICREMSFAMKVGKSMEDSFTASQEALLAYQKEMHAGDSMKTTAVCLQIRGDQAKYGHVGDSRLYRFEKNKVKERTLDHSVPQMLVNRGMIKEKDIRHHEDRSRLLRVMGTPWDSPKYTISEETPITDGTCFLLCSDGFWELIDEKNMCKCLKASKTPDEWLDRMAAIVKKNGQGKNMDNFTATAVFCRKN